jgi:hypothetical protein
MSKIFKRRKNIRLDKIVLIFHIISFSFVFSAISFLFSSLFLIIEGNILIQSFYPFIKKMFTDTSIIISLLAGALLGVLIGFILGKIQKKNAEKKILLLKDVKAIKTDIFLTLILMIILFLFFSLILSGFIGLILWNMFAEKLDIDIVKFLLTFGIWCFIWSSLLTVGVAFLIPLNIINSYYKLEREKENIKNLILNKNFQKARKKIEELKKKNQFLKF